MTLPVTKPKDGTDAVDMGPSRPGDVPDLGTLRQLWRFRDYGRAELRSLLLGSGLAGCELAADLAAPWPLALVINGLQHKNKDTGVLAYFAAWFGGSAVAMLAVAAVATLVITTVCRWAFMTDSRSGS
jgi:ABC-type multidrug transport system fused ATPase/permease subunit